MNRVHPVLYEAIKPLFQVKEDELLKLEVFADNLRAMHEELEDIDYLHGQLGEKILRFRQKWRGYMLPDRRNR